MPLTLKAPTLLGSRVLEERARGLASLCCSHAGQGAGICPPSQHSSLAADPPSPQRPQPHVGTRLLSKIPACGYNYERCTEVPLI